MKSLFRKCVICKRYQGNTLVPPESPGLPKLRIESSHAYQVIGLDYAGPFFMKNSNMDAPSKAYILLLTCTSSRAIHLELVRDMKAPAFIRTLERFIVTCGMPDIVKSDNFKTFKSIEVKRFMTHNIIRQEFILPAAPWVGGFYELVKSIKLPLRKILGKSLFYEEMKIVLCEVESILNSRPLFYSSEDDLHKTLTLHYLVYGRNILLNQRTLFSDEMNASQVSKRHLHLCKIIKEYWKIFSNTYLNEVRQHHLYRKSKHSNVKSPAAGDVVLIRGDNIPRCQWRMGRVEELTPGRDRLIRGVKLIVMSKAGILATCYRLVQKIIPFEIVDDIDFHETIGHDDTKNGVNNMGVWLRGTS